MRILVYGNNKFDDYATFMRGMVVAIEGSLYENEKRITVFAGGPHKINQFVAEFVNKTELFFKDKGYKIKFQRVNPKDLSNEFDKNDINHVLYLSTRNDHAEIFDAVITKATDKNIPVSIYKL
jgi:hypothetical protein